MKRICILLHALLIAALSGCSGTTAVSQKITLPGSAVPQVWIDAPLPGAKLPLAPYEFVAHGADQTGILQIEWTLNGAPLYIETAEKPSGKLGTYRFLWTPSGPGMYSLRARVKNGANVWSEFDEAVFSMGEPTSTPAPSPTTTPTSTATETPTFTPTPSETPTPTSTSSPVALQFSSSASVSQIFSGSCSPNALDLSVTVEPAPYSVVLFLHLVDTASGSQTDWSSYNAMNPTGGGRFTITVQARSIPDVQRFASARLVYQFIATSSTGEVIGRSPGEQGALVSACGNRAIITPTLPPVAINTVTPFPRITSPPPFIPSPTKTREFVK